ncbi:MAG: TIGR04283 family arsenosugar biosynthesis glycosyltransferase [Cyanobacteriota bacterium]|nr:TIGR04283 family arsenosugar biosynthesis glycosyltransferase [Cyanobacteriota bacterium]
MNPSLADLSVIVAARQEATRLPWLLADLAGAGLADLVVVDGGSNDGTAELAALAGAHVLPWPPGRGGQLAAGVARSRGAWLLLLHADVRLPPDWRPRLARAMAAGPAQVWYFDLAIEAPGLALRLVEKAVALRSRLRQLPYGDQGLLVHRGPLMAVGGVPPLPLMEDLLLVERLRRQLRLRSLGAPLRVEARRWQQLGVWRATWRNARLRRAWRRGTPAEQLARLY